MKPQFRSSQHDQSKSKKNSKMKNEENTESGAKDGLTVMGRMAMIFANIFWLNAFDVNV